MRDSKDIETVEPSPGLAGLTQKIASRTAKVAVIGMGYVGVPTMVAAAEVGFSVIGIDTNEDRVREINAGKSYIQDVSDSALGSLVSQGLISASTDYGVVRDLDVILVCVPTPITKFKEPDLAAMEGAVAGIAANLGQQQLIVFQSTTFPGNTEEFALPELEGNGHKVGRDFYLAFALERIDPGNRQFLVRDLENVFRSVNIALVNELSILCHRMNIDIWEVVDAASTKPFGFMPFYPGPGVGGHCIPVDPFYLSWKAKEYDFYVNFIQLAAETNDHMPYYTLSRIGEILNDHGLPLRGSKLLVLGVTFKADVNDTRNSPALRVLELLAENGAEVSYSDRYAPKISVKGKEMNSLELDAKVIQGFDASVIMVNHSGSNVDELISHSKLVIDGQNATKGKTSSTNIITI